MLFFVTGANGAGKTACIPALARLLPTAAIHDFADLGVPEHPDIIWRQLTTEAWLRRYIETYQADRRHVVISGEAVFGEIQAAPSINEVDEWHACLLDCGDIERVDRLRRRATFGPNQDILSWAAWLRVHSVDPAWCPEAIQTISHPSMAWQRLPSFQRGDPRWQQPIIDTTNLTIDETAAAIAAWVNRIVGGRS